MFRATFSPIFRSTRLCVTACGIMHPRCCRLVAWKRRNLLKWVPSLPSYRPATSWVHYTTSCNAQSSAPEDGRKYRPKHVELIGIINKPLLLHLVGCLYYLYQFKNITVQYFRWDKNAYSTKGKCETHKKKYLENRILTGRGIFDRAKVA